MTQTISKFDRMVALVMVGLVAAIGVVLLLGDRVGVQLERYSPTTQAAGTTPISLVFSEVMNWDSVIDHLQFTPELIGAYASNNKTLRFTPAEPLPPGTVYQVQLNAGAVSTGGRQVLQDAQFSFQIRQPRVAYLMPADGTPQNIWIASADGVPEQLTFSPTGILNFDASADGTTIAFAEKTTTGTSDIKLLDLTNGSLRQITNCVDSLCNTPVWRPDGNMMAYQRVDLNSGLGNLGVSPTRIWLIDLTTAPPTDRPLFDDNQILGYAPQWSADSQRVALYDSNQRAIMIYQLEDGSLTVIPNGNGGSDVALSPDGNQVVFPELIFEEDTGKVRSVLKLASLTDGTVSDLTDVEAPVDDGQSAWDPAGEMLAVARRITTEGAPQTRQIYLVDSATGEAEALVEDERYFNGYFSWNAQGDQLVIQRFPQFTESGEFNALGRPEIWTYDLESDNLLLIAENAYLPQWVP